MKIIPKGDIEIKIIGLRPGEKLYEELLIGENPQKTSHDKIKKTQDPFIPFYDLNLDLNILRKQLQNNNIHEIKKILEKLVSSYKPNTKIVDHLFVQHPNLNDKNQKTKNLKE